jgi:S-adenosylmethionine hydrolase
MLITLTTDLGFKDAYVGVMKGVILGINPGTTIVDLCHEIEPQNIRQAAFLLHISCPYFPKDAIHIVVVDPGVGTKRRLVLVISPLGRFLAPDNGVLSYILGEGAFEAFELSNRRYWLPSVSSTFHGRDILAPVAAHLSLGTSPQKLGKKATGLVSFPIPRPEKAPGSLRGEVLHIDTFGNLITNIREDDLPKGRLTVEIAGHTIEKLGRTYAVGRGLLALVGSSGYLEIAARNKNAARLLKARVGKPVRVVAT